MFILVSCVAVTGVWWLRRRAIERGDSASFLLAALPFALLYLAVPVPFAALSAVRSFQALGRTHLDPATVSALAVSIAQPIWLGGFLLVGVLCGVAALAASTRRSLGSSASPPAVERWGSVLGLGFLSVLSVLALPVLGLAQRTMAVAALIAQAGTTKMGTLADGAAATQLNPADVALAVSKGLTLAVFAGFPLVVLLLVAGAIIAVVSKLSLLDVSARFSWTVFALVALASVGFLIVSTMSLLALQQIPRLAS